MSQSVKGCEETKECSHPPLAMKRKRSCGASLIINSWLRLMTGL